jgi:hypothetical protein
VSLFQDLRVLVRSGIEVNVMCRFVSPDIAKNYDLYQPAYEGIDQVVEVGSNGEKL